MYKGLKVLLLIGCLSSQGSTNNTAIAPNINTTPPNLSGTALFRVTGTCYFWQFSIFDGDQSGTVYTDSQDFSSANTATPTFSHHKLTVFEYADGVTIPTGYTISDLSMYYSKLSNAYNTETGRNIDQK